MPWYNLTIAKRSAPSGKRWIRGIAAGSFYTCAHANASKFHICVWYDDRAREEAEKMRTQWYGAICKQAAIETCNQIRCCCWHCRWKELLPESKKRVPLCARSREKYTNLMKCIGFEKFLRSLPMHNAALFPFFVVFLQNRWYCAGASFFLFATLVLESIYLFVCVCVCFGLHHTATRIYSAHTKKKVYSEIRLCK